MHSTNCCPEHISATDCYDLERLQNLTSKDVMVVTDAALMRGVDYRVQTGTEGISLLIMSCFESTRAYV